MKVLALSRLRFKELLIVEVMANHIPDADDEVLEDIANGSAVDWYAGSVYFWPCGDRR